VRVVHATIFLVDFVNFFSLVKLRSCQSKTLLWGKYFILFKSLNLGVQFC